MEVSISGEVKIGAFAVAVVGTEIETAVDEDCGGDDDGDGGLEPSSWDPLCPLTLFRVH